MLIIIKIKKIIFKKQKNLNYFLNIKIVVKFNLVHLLLLLSICHLRLILRKIIRLLLEVILTRKSFLLILLRIVLRKNLSLDLLLDLSRPFLPPLLINHLYKIHQLLHRAVTLPGQTEKIRNKGSYQILRNKRRCKQRISEERSYQIS